jgi:crotonobetainyl-CoA:carnitine CoA-transferase CaiB-like acyl-CoA transferase
MADNVGVLDGMRVLELGHFVAAPFCARLLGDLGADIIKIEPAAGDPVRQWGEQISGNSLWWSVHGRNKRSVSLDLKAPNSAELIKRLVSKCDAVVENFRPGYLASLGLDDNALRAVNPSLVIAHISGFGQTGAQKNRAAFGVIAESIGGLRYLTNHAPGTSTLPPVRVGVSIGDSIAGLYAAFGIAAALWQRDRKGGGRRGRTLDVALTESVLSMMEGMLPEYGALGKIRQPAGSGIPTASPSNAYPTADGDWLIIAANSDLLFQRLAKLMNRLEMLEDPKFKGNRERVANSAALDQIISQWTKKFSSDELDRKLADANIPATKIYTAAHCAADLQFLERGMVHTVDDPILGPVLHPGIVPRVSEEPGRVRWPGQPIGAQTEQVFEELLGMRPDQIAAMRGGNTE